MDYNMPDLVSFKGYENNMNPLLDMIIDNITNNNSLMPSDEEIESTKSKMIHNIEEIYDQGQITGKRMDILIQRIRDYFEDSIKILKSFEDQSSRILEAAQAMNTCKQCPRYVLLKMYHSFDLPKLCQYMELIKNIIDDLGLSASFKYLSQPQSDDEEEGE